MFLYTYTQYIYIFYIDHSEANIVLGFVALVYSGPFLGQNIDLCCNSIEDRQGRRRRNKRGYIFHGTVFILPFSIASQNERRNGS